MIPQIWASASGTASATSKNPQEILQRVIKGCVSSMWKLLLTLITVVAYATPFSGRLFYGELKKSHLREGAAVQCSCGELALAAVAVWPLFPQANIFRACLCAQERKKKKPLNLFLLLQSIQPPESLQSLITLCFSVKPCMSLLMRAVPSLWELASLFKREIRVCSLPCTAVYF